MPLCTVPQTPSPSARAPPTHHLVQDAPQEVAVLVLLHRLLSQLLQTSLLNRGIRGFGIHRGWEWWGSASAGTDRDRQHPAWARAGLPGCRQCLLKTPRLQGRSPISQLILGVGRSLSSGPHPCHPVPPGHPCRSLGSPTALPRDLRQLAQLHACTFWKLSFRSCSSSWKPSTVVFREQMVVSISCSMSMT